MKRRIKSLHAGLVLRYTVFFLVSIVAILLMLMAFMGYFFESMTSEMSEGPKNTIYFSGNYSDGSLVMENMPIGTVWVDFLKDGKVVHSIGDRGISVADFSTDVINQMLTSVFYGPREFGHTHKVLFYPYDEDSVEVALIFGSVNEEFTIGITVPDEFKGTAVEAELNRKLNGVFLLILLAIGLVIVFFSILTFRMIIKPIQSMNAGLMAVKHGELSTRIDYKGYRELMALTEAFNEMTERLEHAENEAVAVSESKKSMILNLSHDLRTPATVVKGYAQALFDGKVSEDKKQKYFGYMLEKSSVMVSRIEQLFAYAKLDVRHYDLNFERLDLCEFVRVMVIGYLEEFSAFGQRLEMDVPDAPLWCKADPLELKRALGNLIENAIKYSGEGSQIWVSVRASEGKSGFEVIVEDNGVGLWAKAGGEVVEALFQPFARGDLSRHTDGTGLGLAITRQIARLHGGDVRCEPLEQGIRFVFGFGDDLL